MKRLGGEEGPGGGEGPTLGDRGYKMVYWVGGGEVLRGGRENGGNLIRAICVYRMWDVGCDMLV